VFIFGVLLAGSFLRDTLRALPLAETFPELLAGAACLYGSLFRKRIYLAPEGIVRETQSPFACGREVLPWSEVRHVTLAFRKQDMLALFEKGTMGWRVPYRRNQEAALREILARCLPGAEIENLFYN
jgi:hypothetical protein